MLWLWGRPAAVALTRPLAWKPPYAPRVALKSKKRRNKIKKYIEFQAVAVGLVRGEERKALQRTEA